MKIGIFDPSIGTGNLGDHIIMDSVHRELDALFQYQFKINFPSQEKISLISYKKIRKMNKSFVGGTNCLSSNMNKRNQWKINLIDGIFINNAILLGVGWWQYQSEPNWYTKRLLKRVLHEDYIHSVRDSFAEQQLKNIGITNVLNTSCPTTWRLTEEHCSRITVEQAENVVFTITDYMKDVATDKALIKVLVKNYKKVYFWIQGSDDLEYFKSLHSGENIEIIPPTLEAYDRILENVNSLDYIGTRLHAGIRALQKKVRTIIVGIDNRAIEKSKDINLKIILRDDIEDKLELMLKEEFKTDIRLPITSIEKWKKQFETDQGMVV